MLAALACAGSAIGRGPGLAADTAYGEYLAGECAGCHGAAGSGGALPLPAGLYYDRLVAVLKEYRDGTRANPTMRSVARSLGDAEIEAVAAYLAGRS